MAIEYKGMTHEAIIALCMKQNKMISEAMWRCQDVIMNSNQRLDDTIWIQDALRGKTSEGDNT